MYDDVLLEHTNNGVFLVSIELLIVDKQYYYIYQAHINYLCTCVENKMTTLNFAFSLYFPGRF